MAMKKAILIACFAAVAGVSPAFAQRWGQSGFPREGVCFFKDPNFRGDYFCARSGENITAVSEGMNDRYLRSQGQEQGVASYGRVVDLLVAEDRARAAGVLRSPK